MKHKQYSSRRLRHILSIPFIYMVILPALVLDVGLEIYHRICFPLYGLPYIRRRQYIKIDREKLAYLNLFQKVNCMYCGYVNGLFHYASRLAAETEKYWCGIQHNKDRDFIPPEHHKDFLPYGDESAFREFTKKK